MEMSDDCFRIEPLENVFDQIPPTIVEWLTGDNMTLASALGVDQCIGSDVAFADILGQGRRNMSLNVFTGKIWHASFLGGIEVIGNAFIFPVEKTCFFERLRAY